MSQDRKKQGRGMTITAAAEPHRRRKHGGAHRADGSLFSHDEANPRFRDPP